MFGGKDREIRRLVRKIHYLENQLSVECKNSAQLLQQVGEMQKKPAPTLRDYTVCWDDDTSDTHRADNLTHLAEGSVVVFWQGGVKTGIVRDYVSIDSKPVEDKEPATLPPETSPLDPASWTCYQGGGGEPCVSCSQGPCEPLQ